MHTHTHTDTDKALQTPANPLTAKSQFTNHFSSIRAYKWEKESWRNINLYDKYIRYNNNMKGKVNKK